MKFNCLNDQLEIKWSGEIKRYEQYNNSYYIYVSAKGSGLEVYFSKAQNDEWLVSIPNHNSSLIIGSLHENVEYNSEKIGAALNNKSDGESISHALLTFYTTHIINIFKRNTTSGSPTINYGVDR